MGENTSSMQEVEAAHIQNNNDMSHETTEPDWFFWAWTMKGRVKETWNTISTSKCPAISELKTCYRFNQIPDVKNSCISFLGSSKHLYEIEGRTRSHNKPFTRYDWA